MPLVLLVPLVPLVPLWWGVVLVVQLVPLQLLLPCGSS